MNKVRLPKKGSILKWFLENYGCGGVENYFEDNIENVIKGLKLILNNCDSVELEFLGKVLIKISDMPFLKNKFLDELDNEFI